MPTVIDMEIERVMTPLRNRMTHCEKLVESHRMRLNNLTARLEEEEESKGISSVLDTMRGQHITFLASAKHFLDVDQLRSTDISILWGDVPLPDVPSYMPQTMPYS
uniref:Uncharacterized protein n=1 Tax=Solanum tuberosum TaxID=4113 RepID=M1DGR5_SOLTU